MRKKEYKKAQSIIEYICVTIVFASVGIGGFILATRQTAANYRGQSDTYKTTDTLMGQTLNDGLSKEEYRWPAEWGGAQNNPQVDPGDPTVD